MSRNFHQKLLATIRAFVAIALIVTARVLMVYVPILTARDTVEPVHQSSTRNVDGDVTADGTAPRTVTRRNGGDVRVVGLPENTNRKKRNHRFRRMRHRVMLGIRSSEDRPQTSAVTY